MAESGKPVTHIAHHTNDAIFVRGENLVDDLIGRISFTDMIFLHLMGTRPCPAQTAILDAVLVTLMEHGLTPSVIAARMTYMGAPEAMQGAVAAGLLGVGSQFIGTMEQAAALIAQVRDAGEGAAEAARKIAEHHRENRLHMPGFGHPLHRPDDPRSPRLLGLVESLGVDGGHIAALRALASAVDVVNGRHLTINATGAVAAVLGEADIPTDIMRGIAVISRAAGLVGHVREEQQSPAGRAIWQASEQAVPYADDQT